MYVFAGVTWLFCLGFLVKIFAYVSYKGKPKQKFYF